MDNFHINSIESITNTCIFLGREREDVDYLVYAYYLVLLIVLLKGAKLSKIGQWSEEFLSLEQTKSIQGFCTICIMFHHIAQKTYAPWLPSKYIVHGLDVFVSIGYLPVGIFFFCSGYGLYKSYQTKEGYLNHFFSSRFMIPIMTLLSTSIIFIYLQIKKGGSPSVVPIPFTLQGAKLPNSYSWYIYTILICYLAFYFAFRYCKDEKVAIGVIVTVVLLYILFCDWWMYGDWWYNTVFLFPVGLIFAKKENSLILFMKKRYLLFLLSFVLLTVIGFQLGEYTQSVLSQWSEDYNYTLYRWLHLIMQMSASGAFVFSVILINMKVCIGNRFLMWMGSLTLEFYLIHGLFVQMFGYCFIEEEMGTFFYIRNVALMTFVVFILSFVSSLILNVFNKIISSFLIKYIHVVAAFFKDAKKLLLVCTVILLLLIVKDFINNKNIIKRKEDILANYKQNNITFVEVDNKQMSAYVTGSGEHTLVILSKLSDFCPTITMKPLADLLAKDYKVIVLDYFGVGFSDDTDKPRIGENYVNEIHEAITHLVNEKSYILVSHESAGIYEQLYVHTYPQEVKAVIGLDSDVGNLLFEQIKEQNLVPLEYQSLMRKQSLLTYAGQKLLSVTGLARKEWKMFESTYTLNSEEELQILEEKFIQCYYGKNVTDEMIYYYENCKLVKDWKYEKNMPVKMFLSYWGSKKMTRQGYDWNQLHEDLLQNSKIQSTTVLVSNSSLIYREPGVVYEKMKEYIQQIK